MEGVVLHKIVRAKQGQMHKFEKGHAGHIIITTANQDYFEGCADCAGC